MVEILARPMMLCVGAFIFLVFGFALGCKFCLLGIKGIIERDVLAKIKVCKSVVIEDIRWDETTSTLYKKVDGVEQVVFRAMTNISG